MYILRYTKLVNTSQETYKVIYREFDTLEKAIKERSTLSPSISSIQILAPYEDQVNYREKFEELYDHLLKQSNIREKSVIPKDTEFA